MVSGSLVALVLAVSARWAYEDAYDNVEGGAWYEGQNNEESLLAWGESYVMSSLAAMYRAHRCRDALVRAPLEVWLPSHSGTLARLADMMPRAAQTIEPLLRKRGASRQRQA